MTNINEKLNMSLDDVIKMEKGKTSEKSQDDGYQRKFKKPFNKNRYNSEKRYNDYKPFNKSKRTIPWDNQKPDNNFQQNSRGSFRRKGNYNPEDKTRLKVENLHYNIVNAELNELFSSVGPLVQCNIQWDNMGRSKGTAIVEYKNAHDAMEAIKQYDNAELDGKILRVRYFTIEDQREIENESNSDGKSNNKDMSLIRKKIFKPNKRF